ncbi:MAG: T9SS type A sorting domain-containing protein [Bacteroidetes bacterium]|nr:T9SS type A sorting domain-containing protein [Bacteroidota bacterium]
MKKIAGIVLLLTFIVHVQLKGQVLNVPEITQEQNQWCWAGVSACALDYYCTTTAQCDIAEYTRTVATWHSFGSTDCCVNPNVGCNYWNYNWGYPGSIQDILIHFANISNDGYGSYLTLSDITYYIQLNRVFIIRWGWTSGGGHFVVGHGISGNNIYYMDPWYGEGYKIATYDWVRSDGNHTWTHTNTLSVSPPSKPPTPSITQNGHILSSDAPAGNQWYDQTGLINGATNQTYDVTQNGAYYVIVTILDCISDTSNTINVDLTGVTSAESNTSIKVYPNPVTNELTIETHGNKEETGFDILNSRGQVVFKGTVTEKTLIQTGSFSPGVYVIQLDNGMSFEFKKIIKK